MNCLLIDTSKPQVLVALIKDGRVADQESWAGDKTLGTKLLSVIDELLVKNSLKLEDIDRIAVHGGPGHYSALRSGIVAATFLAQSSGAELVQIEGDDFEIMIQNALAKEPVQVVVPEYKG
ncbi:MAG: tRNA (adenosine(37)-N6)-threonylcarbamoyltransferase complex dimerization subunit type 1 TsaB [Candidatus Andersenbacteria bacterium]|nr:tRNA (adenosine(37)-N6)-threonylcarbamoyltransferase complex dimerization subunit type 1 TsaB [Candidatus Andersenbacteria bacterium]